MIPGFQEALKRKYDILQQNADSTAQAVAQRGLLQNQADQAALERSRLLADTQTRTAGMHAANAVDLANIQGNYGLLGRQAANQGALDVANVQGGYGLQQAQIRAKQPEFGMTVDPLSGETREWGKNQSARDILKQEREGQTSLVSRLYPAHRSLGFQGLGLGLPGYRRGGEVAAGRPIVVGEDGREDFVPVGGLPVPVGQGGPEAIVPQRDGVIVPNPRTVAATAGRGRTGPLTPEEIGAIRAEIEGSGGMSGFRVAGPGYSTTAPRAAAPEPRPAGGLPAPRAATPGSLGVLEGRGDGPITLNGDVIDPGRAATLGGGSAGIGSTAPPPTWNPESFYSQLGGMRSKDEQLAAYAALPPERRRALREWMGQRENALPPATPSGTAAPPLQMAPAHQVGGLRPLPLAPANEAPMSATDAARAGVSWAVNRPQATQAAPEVRAVLDALAPVARRVGEAGLLYATPVDLARAGVVNAASGLVRPVAEVGGQIVRNFDRAARGLPTYVEDRQRMLSDNRARGGR